MKVNHLAAKTIMGVVLSFGLVSGLQAVEAPRAQEIVKALKSTVRVEIPAKVVALIAQSEEQDREQAAFIAIREAIRLSPKAAATIVGQVAKAYPELAANAAVVAAHLEPSQLMAIAHAAAVSAPEQAELIVKALNKSNPMKFKETAYSVALGAPAKSGLVFDATMEALPGLRHSIQTASTDAIVESSSIFRSDISAASAATVPVVGVNVTIFHRSLARILSEAASIFDRLGALPDSAKQGDGQPGIAGTADDIAKQILNGLINPDNLLGSKVFEGKTFDDDERTAIGVVNVEVNNDPRVIQADLADAVVDELVIGTQNVEMRSYSKSE